MKPYWDFLVSALQAQLGKELGQLVAWLLCIFVILGVVIPLYMIMKAATKLGGARDHDMGAIPGTNNPVTGRTLSVGEPLVVRLDKGTIQRARDLLNAGQDLEAVCHEIEPAYANWSFPQQRGFRKAMEAALEPK
jgi:hypothetical protein